MTVGHAQDDAKILSGLGLVDAESDNGCSAKRNTRAGIAIGARPQQTYDADRSTEAAERDAFYLSLRRWTLKRFGLTLESYEAKHAAQGGACAICGKPETAVRGGRVKRLAVDHDRQTGQLRDLLCNRCNMALGLFGEDVEALRRAATYLEHHRALTHAR